MRVLDHGTSLLPAVPGSFPLAKELLSWGKRGKREMSPQHGGGAGSIPGTAGGIGCSVAITALCRGTDRAFSQAGGDDPQTTESGGPGVPVHKGTKPAGAGALQWGGVPHCPVPYAVAIKE